MCINQLNWYFNFTWIFFKMWVPKPLIVVVVFLYIVTRVVQKVRTIVLYTRRRSPTTTTACVPVSSICHVSVRCLGTVWLRVFAR